MDQVSNRERTHGPDAQLSTGHTGAGPSAFALPGTAWTLGAVLATTVLMVALTACNRAWEHDSPTTGTAPRAALVPGLLWVAAIFASLA